MPEAVLLIYDRDCAFCQKCADWGKRNLKRFPECIGFQDLNPSDYGLSIKDVQSSIWLIQPKKPPISANEAAAAILRMQPNYLWRLLGTLSDTYWVRPFARLIYFTIAKNRHKMPGATESCELPDDK